MNLIDIWTTSVEGIIKQGGYAIENGRCRLRTEDGKRCAVGQFIPS